MDIADVFYASSAILVSVGGAAAIIFGLSSWLGKVWANRILEQDKLRYTSELEEIKSKLQADLQQRQLIFSLYFEGQFKIYNDLWISLSELQDSVDSLWSEANHRNLQRLVSMLTKAKKQIRSSAILINPDHYREIMIAIEQFEAYQIGKERLVHARRMDDVPQEMINQLIDQNRGSREQINLFASRVLDMMRGQIGGQGEQFNQWPISVD